MTARPSAARAGALLLAATSACVHVPLRERAAYRLDEYFASHGEIAPVAYAMRRGHIALGMDEEQVLAVLGNPVRRTRYEGRGAAQVWTYRGHQLHQGYAHGASLYRLVFLDGRLRVLEPI